MKSIIVRSNIYLQKNKHNIKDILLRTTKNNSSIDKISFEITQ